MLKEALKFDIEEFNSSNYAPIKHIENIINQISDIPMKHDDSSNALPTNITNTSSIFK